MPRILLLLLLVLLLAGGLYFLSTLPEEAPVRTIETEVVQGGNAS